MRPLREVTMWWQPSGWAAGMVCTRGFEGSVVENTLMEEEPEAARRWVGVTAMENMSVGCAGCLC
jgi:hypothetical protein